MSLTSNNFLLQTVCIIINNLASFRISFTFHTDNVTEIIIYENRKLKNLFVSHCLVFISAQVCPCFEWLHQLSLEVCVPSYASNIILVFIDHGPGGDLLHESLLARPDLEIYLATGCAQFVQSQCNCRR